MNLIDSLRRRIREAEEDKELLLYELELAADSIKNRHGELGKRLKKLLGRKTVSKCAEEKIYGIDE